MNKVEAGIQYAQDVVKGNIDVCENVQLACQRFLNYIDDKAWQYEFIPKYAQHVLDFASYQKHTKGPDAGTPVVLQPWQVFVINSIYGFRHKKDNKRRMTTDVIIFIPRKAGKSTLTAIIGLYELLFGEKGPEVFVLATNNEQSRIVFDAARGFIESTNPKIADHFKVRQHDIMRKGDVQSMFKALSRDTKKSGDGKNPSCAIIDEAAAITERNSIEVLHSGMVARSNPLRVYITTASFTRETKFYEDLSMFESILKGRARDNPQWFGVLYGLDAGDEWSNPATWAKVNPMHGISVFEEAIAARVREAQDKPSSLNELLCKTFNVWVSSNSAWIDHRLWEDESVIIEEFRDAINQKSTFVGFDLAHTRDLNAVCLLRRFNENDYEADFKFFLPEASLEFIPSHYLPIYKQAISTKSLVLTPGNVMDVRYIADYISTLAGQHEIKEIGYDNYNAAQVVALLTERGLNMKKVSQGMATLNNPSKEVERLIFSKSIKHKKDPFVTWQLGNCEVYTDVNNNIKVRKNEADPSAKVDGIISMIIAMYVSLDNLVQSEWGGFGSFMLDD